MTAPTGARTLVVVGAATRDIDAEDPRGWRLGGTVVYAAFAAARIGVSVRALIGVDLDTVTADELQLLAAAGVEIALVGLAQGPVFDNRETEAGRVQHAFASSEPIPASGLPDAWRESDAVVLGPVAGELDDDWAAALPATTFVALGWQGLLREMQPGQPVKRLPLRGSKLVERADALLLSSEDAAGSTARIRELLRDGQQLVVTYGRRGAMHFQRTAGDVHARYLPAIPTQQQRDTTGVGDVFLGAWIATRLLTAAPDPGKPGATGANAATRPLAVAAAMGSLAASSHAGLAHVPSRSDLCELLVRLRDQHPR